MSSKDFWQFIPDIETERRIVINWRNGRQNSTNDWIGLFNTHSKTIGNPVFKFEINGRANGSHRTALRIDNLDFNRDNVINGCLKLDQMVWRIVYISNNQTIAENCFKTHPNWMESSLKYIGNKRLDQIAIPGAHDAGCYNRYGLNNIPTKSVYLYAQDETIFDQLVYGIRYFDMRISFDEQLFDSLQVVHNHWRCDHSVKSVLTQIKDFLIIARKEIIIFDVHKLKGFDDIYGNPLYDRHQKLIDLIKEMVGNYIIPESYKNKTIEEILESGRRLVIGYVDKHRLKNMTDSEVLWEGVEHLWPNSNSIEGIENFFERQLCPQSDRGLHSAMAQMTPTVKEILFNFNTDNGLRQRADYVNPYFRHWFWHKWWNCINIVSADYFLGSNVVEITIKVNERRFSSNAPKKHFLLIN